MTPRRSIAVLGCVLLLAGCARMLRESPESLAARQRSLTASDVAFAKDDATIRRIQALVVKVVTATPVPVDRVLVYSSGYANRVGNKKTYADANAQVTRCGPKGSSDKPWGCIFVGDALIDQMNEDAMAGLLAHELGHLENGHDMGRAGTTTSVVSTIGSILSYVPGPIGWAGTAINLGAAGANVGLLAYSRDHEREADASAGVRLAAAGYCAGPAMRETFASLMRLKDGASGTAASSGGGGIFSTHPSLQERWENAGTECDGKERTR
jgi:Zn-dependent protease with chaperone function